MIRTRGLTKRFGAVVAVDGIDLDVRAGDVYGFLGANGSGKTTTVRMLLGLVLATSGEAEVLGRPMPRAAATVLPAGRHAGRRARPSRAPVRPREPRDLRRRWAARRRRASPDPGRRRASSGSAWPSRHDRRVTGYSLGMRQRLGLAAALLRGPELLVLDEPTNGLDPQGIREMRELLLALNAEGTTIFLSSHLLAEVEQMCTRVGVLDRGRLVVQDELALCSAPTGRTVVLTPDADAGARRCSTAGSRSRDGERLRRPRRRPGALNAMLVRRGRAGRRARRPSGASLEEVVLGRATPAPDQVEARS